MSDQMCAVILAAGRGTRMGALTDSCPKALLPVNGKPGLERVILALREAGFREFILVIGYLGDLIRRTIGSGEQWNVKISYVEQLVPKGTGHALSLAENEVNGRDFLLTFGDIQTSAYNYASLTAKFTACECAATAALRDVDDPWRAAAVYMDNFNIISRILEKPDKGTSTTRWAHAGAYCFSNRVYDYLKQIKPSQRGELEATSAVELMICSGERILGVPWTGYWSDLATPEDLANLEMILEAQA